MSNEWPGLLLYEVSVDSTQQEINREGVTLQVHSM